MSGGETIASAWSAMLRDTLRHAPGVAGRVAFGDASGRAGLPVLTLSAVEAKPWHAAERPGRELRATLTLADRGAAGRIEAIAAAVEAAVFGVPRTGAGWESAGARVVASRIGQRKDGAREARIELLARAWSV